jgi:hypothetical protein
VSKTDPSYSFETSLFGDDTWALEARKEWQTPNGTAGRDVLVLDLDLGNGQGLDAEASRLTALHQTEGLKAAMRAAERLSVANGFLDPERDDPHLFAFGPPDPFTTELEQERIQALSGQNEAFIDTEEVPQLEVDEYFSMYRETGLAAEQRQQANAPLQGAEWFEATFEGFDQELLQPLHDTVNYAVVVQADDPWTLELAVEKHWREPDGTLGVQSQTLDTYDPNMNAEDADQKRDALMQVYDERGLEALMHKAELTAMENGYLDGNRADTRLFTQGPPDRFETLAHQLEDDLNPFWNIGGEIVQRPLDFEEHTPYWQLETLPVNDPQGEPLGHALHMVVYPEVDQDSAAAHDPALRTDEPFQLLEMAHFDTVEAVDDFKQEFNGYLAPGIMKGPDLAVEVARLEGLPVEWKTLEGDDRRAFQEGHFALAYKAADWHLYNPHADQDARIAAEGDYDLSQSGMSFEKNLTDQQAESLSPDFDL